MNIETLLAIFGGTQVVVVALIGYLATWWLKRFEIKLKQTLDRAKHVSQARFDREFLFYQELWKHVSGLRKAIRDTILPFSSIVETSDTVRVSTDDLREHCKSLLLKSENYWEFVESNKPFFPKEMIEYLDSYRNDSYSWGTELLGMDRLTIEWYSTKGAPKILGLNAIADSLEEAIRTRLENLGGQT